MGRGPGLNKCHVWCARLDAGCGPCCARGLCCAPGAAHGSPCARNKVSGLSLRGGSG